MIHHSNNINSVFALAVILWANHPFLTYVYWKVLDCWCFRYFILYTDFTLFSLFFGIHWLNCILFYKCLSFGLPLLLLFLILLILLCDYVPNLIDLHLYVKIFQFTSLYRWCVLGKSSLQLLKIIYILNNLFNLNIHTNDSIHVGYTHFYCHFKVENLQLYFTFLLILL